MATSSLSKPHSGCSQTAGYLLQTMYTSPCNNPVCPLNILTVPINYVLLLKWLFAGFSLQTPGLYAKPVTENLVLWKASLRKPQFTLRNIITPFFTTRSWSRHCATSRKVAGSIPDGVVGIFHWHNPSGRTVALGLTQPLTEMSTRNISWGIKAAGALGWQLYYIHVTIFLKSGSLKLLEPSGPVQACSGIALPFTE